MTVPKWSSGRCCRERLAAKAAMTQANGRMRTPGDPPRASVKRSRRTAPLFIAVATSGLWAACDRSREPDVVTGLLRDYVLLQEAYHADHNGYAREADSLALTVPPGVTFTIISSSAVAHGALAHAEEGGPHCAVWVGERPPRLDDAREGEPECGDPARFHAWMEAARPQRNDPLSSLNEASDPVRPVLVDSSACAADPVDPTSGVGGRQSVPARMRDGVAELTVDRPLPVSLASRPTGAFRANHVALDGDTVWFTESEACPVEAVAYIRSTGEWTTTIRPAREDSGYVYDERGTRYVDVPCRTSPSEPKPEARGGPVPNPDAGSPPRQLDETNYSDPTFQDSVPLADGLWLELVVTPVSTESRPATRFRNGREVRMTKDAHYVLHVPKDTSGIILRITDEQWQAASVEWDRLVSGATASSRVTHWLMSGNSLYFALARDLDSDWFPNRGVAYRIARAGAILHVDLATQQVTPILHRRLSDWSAQDMYVQRGALWDVGRYGYQSGVDGHVEAIFYGDFGPGVMRVFRWNGTRGGCDALRAPGAVVAGDSVWAAYPDRVTIIDFGNATESTLYYRDSIFTRRDGVDTIMTFLSRAAPGVRPAVGDSEPTDDHEHARWLARHLRVRRVEGFIDAYLALPETARQATRHLANHLFHMVVDGPYFVPKDTLSIALAHPTLVPFLNEAWWYVSEISTPWYDGLVAALDSLGVDYLTAALRMALDSAPTDRATHSAGRLRQLGDSTGVEWLARALRDPRRIADTSRIRHTGRRGLDRIIGLATFVRDPSFVPSLIDLLETPHWRAAREALVRITGEATAPQGAGGAAAVAAYWRTWWSDHGDGFTPVSSGVGSAAYRRWRERRCRWDALARDEVCEVRDR